MRTFGKRRLSSTAPSSAPGELGFQDAVYFDGVTGLWQFDMSARHYLFVVLGGLPFAWLR
jgi:hypothetical protein